MEAGINADQNFYRRQYPQSSGDGEGGRDYEPPPPFDFDSRPQVPPKLSLTTNTFHPAATDSFGFGNESPAPDDFYRDFRGPPSSSARYNDVDTNDITTNISTTAAFQQMPSSSRSNGNGTTPKHPTISSSRNALKPPLRSTSAPIDERMALNTAKSTSALNGHLRSQQQPSVKDLLKRFDQNGGQTTAAARKPAARTPSNGTNLSGPGYLRSRSDMQNQTSSGFSKAGLMTRDTSYGSAKSPPTQRTTQRGKFATEDQYSNNTLSSVPRPIRNRAEPSLKATASQIIASPTTNAPQKAPSQIPARRPLFGEVVPAESGPSNVGFGIMGSRPRRTSDSNLQQMAWNQRHQRDQSEADLSPASPTEWYRGAGPALLGDLDTQNTSRQHRKHTRSRSDMVGGRSEVANGRPHADREASKLPSPVSKPTTQSRLPVSSKRSSTSSDSATPPMIRAISPSKSRAPAPNIAQTLKQDPRPWSPAGRSTTPTHRAQGRLSPLPPKLAISSNSSLKAYISAPPPKTSPPLRSSRPRLPVSTATTASSRAKAAERSATPEFNGYKSTRNEGYNTRTGSRILVPGAVDFAARRERIQKAMSKSIQDSEEKELREATAAAVRQREAIQENVPEESQESQEPHTSQDTAALSVDSPLDPTTPTTVIEEDPPAPTLQIDTSFLAPENTLRDYQQISNSIDLDSPTLGIPGSYPRGMDSFDEDEPRSALSSATGFTEFDNEPQTEPARHNQEIFIDTNPTTQPSNDTSIIESLIDSALTTPNDNASIKIILDIASVEESETRSIPNEELNVGGSESSSCHLGYGEPVFATTSPMQSLEDETVEAPGELLGRPESQRYSHGSLVQTSCDESDCDDLEIPHDEATSQPKLLTSSQSDSQPIWHSPPTAALPFVLPAIQTGFGPIDTTYPDLTRTPVTEIDYESSDDARDAAESRNHLYGPGGARLGNRRESDQQSRWTDYSVDTISDVTWQRRQHSSSVPPTMTNRNTPPIPPPKEEHMRPGVPPKPADYSPLPSPRSVGGTPRMTSPVRSFPGDYKIASDLHASDATKTSWGESQSTLPIPAWPNHSPPPPPQPNFSDTRKTARLNYTPPPTGSGNRPTSSVYRSNDDPESRRESADELTSSRPSISTPLSSTRISINGELTPSQAATGEPVGPVQSAGEGKELAEKQSKRLQKRGHIIKELIDTEAVYLKDMNVVEEIYKGTAEACPKLESSDIKTIFRNTNQIVAFSTMFLDELKVASASVYSPRQRVRRSWSNSQADDKMSMTSTLVDESDFEKDQKTRIGEYFGRHLKVMQTVYTDFLKSSEQASSRLSALQNDPAVKVWLSECNLVGKDLTAAWDLDALLIKPVQRITRYQLLLHQLLDATPEDHPDHKFLQTTYREIGGLLKSIDDLKKRIETVNKIVGVAGRKRKDSDMRSGLAKAFGRSREKSVSSANRPAEDEGYIKVHERFSVDYLRLQVVLRDVEFYTRQCQTWTTDFLRYLSAMELFMRTTPSPYPELESKWARFNMSMRDMGTTGLTDHVSAVRKFVIDPMEKVIKAFEPPDLAMKKRKKRRLDYEKYLTLKATNKKVDDKLSELVEQYEALNETLKIELPKLSMMTGEICRISQRRFVGIQKDWYRIWEQKVKTVLEVSQIPKGVEHILDQFNRDFMYQLACVGELSIVNGAFLDRVSKDRLSQSLGGTKDDGSSTKSRKPPPPALSNRSRGLSINSDHSPSLPTPDFLKRHSDHFTFSPSILNGHPLPMFSRGDYPSAMKSDSGSPAVQESPTSVKPYSTRPSTGRSYDSGFQPRQSGESNEPATRSPVGSAYYTQPHPYDSLNPSSRPFSGIFHSAMPVEDCDDEAQRSSRTSSQDRDPSSKYNVLYLAASLFEFNIKDTKNEAGYAYLTYQAGEIFDVIGEKGELWLAKNQDDPSNRVGWIWSKHFAKLADF